MSNHNAIMLQYNFWNSYASKYDEFINRYANNMYMRIVSSISNELRPSDKVIEAGTGTGIIAMQIANKVSEVVATDTASEMLTIANRKLNQNPIRNLSFRLEDINAISYPDKYFDVAIASNVFHLLPEPNQALFELKRVLNDDGKVILPTYCHGENIKARMISKIMTLRGFRVVNRWTINSYREFIRSGGFEISNEEVYKDKIPLSYIVATKIK